MKKLKLHPDDWKKLTGSYTIGFDDSPMLYHCTMEDSKKQLRLTSKMTQCRESFLSYIRRQQITSSVGESDYITSKLVTSNFRFLFANVQNRNDMNKPISIEHLIMNRAKYDKRTLQAVSVVNAIEDHFNWSRTEVYRVEMGDHLGHNMFMFKASKRWNRSPHLASFLLLILRSARMFDMKPFDDIYGAIAQFSEKGLIRKHFQKWYTLLEKFDKIFRGLSHRKLYSEQIITKSKSLSNEALWRKIILQHNDLLSRRKSICASLYNEGIQKLVECDSRYDIVSQRLETYVRLKINAGKPKKQKAKAKATVSYA